jgi:hypothetical protein
MNTAKHGCLIKQSVRLVKTDFVTVVIMILLYCKNDVKKFCFTLDCPCADYSVCRLSAHDRKLLMSNSEGGK